MNERKYQVKQKNSNTYLTKNYGEFSTLMSAPQELVFKSKKNVFVEDTPMQLNSQKSNKIENIGQTNNEMMSLETIVSYSHVIKTHSDKAEDLPLDDLNLDLEINGHMKRRAINLITELL